MSRAVGLVPAMAPAGDPKEGSLMKRLWTFAAMFALSCAAMPLHAETRTWFGFQIGVNGGGPPPAFAFRSEPRVVVVNDVQVVDDDRCDDDMFHSDGMWWRLRGGYWFRSATWRGPWIGVDVRRVPERVLVVPARNWKHHPREGGRTVFVVRDRDRFRDRDHDGFRDHDRDHDRGRHRGHDRDHEHHDHGDDH
jgi:hypothetical protein